MRTIDQHIHTPFIWPGLDEVLREYVGVTLRIIYVERSRRIIGGWICWAERRVDWLIQSRVQVKALYRIGSCARLLIGGIYPKIADHSRLQHTIGINQIPLQVVPEVI